MTVSVNIITLPNDGGSPVIDIEYQINGGTALSLGRTTPGSYPISAKPGDSIKIRARNMAGAIDWAMLGSKSVPAGIGIPEEPETPEEPPAFDGQTYQTTDGETFQTSDNKLFTVKK